VAFNHNLQLDIMNNFKIFIWIFFYFSLFLIELKYKNLLIFLGLISFNLSSQKIIDAINFPFLFISYIRFYDIKVGFLNLFTALNKGIFLVKNT